jgi:hypothetical protein
MPDTTFLTRWAPGSNLEADLVGGAGLGPAGFSEDCTYKIGLGDSPSAQKEPRQNNKI